MPQDSREFRRALGQFATGIAVITARAQDGSPVGLTVNSFSSVSLDPPLILWSLSLYSPSLAVFQHCSHYAVNVLSAQQQALSVVFSGPREDRFSGLESVDGLGGAPLLEGCLARFECRNEIRYAGGDHLIFVGEVERFSRREGDALIYFGGRYRGLQPE